MNGKNVFMKISIGENRKPFAAQAKLVFKLII